MAFSLHFSLLIVIWSTPDDVLYCACHAAVELSYFIIAAFVLAVAAALMVSSVA